MKYSIRVLFFAIIIMISIGYYFKNTGDSLTGDRWVGLGVLVTSFILMPLFIYQRWSNKDIKDYMLTENNIKKMNSFYRKKR